MIVLLHDFFQCSVNRNEHVGYDPISCEQKELYGNIVFCNYLQMDKFCNTATYSYLQMDNTCPPFQAISYGYKSLHYLFP